MIKKQRLTRVLQMAILGIVATIHYGCNYDFESNFMPKNNRVLERKFAIEEVAEWYYSKNVGGNTSPQKVKEYQGFTNLFYSEPDWNIYCTNELRDYIVIDIDLTLQMQNDLFTEENRKLYNEELDWNYLRSYTRMVVLKSKYDNSKTGFLMTLMPSSEYAKNHQKEIRKTIYSKREENYDGYILYHELDGTFSNGWKYKNGKIVASVSAVDATSVDTTNTTGLVKIWGLYTSYQLASQPNRVKKKSVETDDDDIAYEKTLEEIEVVGKKKKRDQTITSSESEDSWYNYFRENYGVMGEEEERGNNKDNSSSDPFSDMTNSSLGSVEGGYGGGNQSNYHNTSTYNPKNDDDLPNRRPKTVIDDCNSVFTKMRQDMYSDYNFFSSYGGQTFGDGHTTPSFQDYLNAIEANPNYEHSLTLAYADEMYYTYEIISLGKENRTGATESPYVIANIHNHPNNTPPSPQDIKTALNIANQASNYSASYTIMPDGTVYVIRLTDRNKLAQFMRDYDKQMTIDTITNRFIKNSDFDKAWEAGTKKFKRLGETTAWEYTIAYLFEKYGMGLTLLKKENGSDAFKVQYLRKGDNDKYELVKCE